MTLTVEISMYPLQEDYRPLIRGFVARLRGYDTLRATTGPTSTVVVGDHDEVMACLTDLFRWSYTEHGRSVFVTKFIPGYDADNPE